MNRVWMYVRAYSYKEDASMLAFESKAVVAGTDEMEAYDAGHRELPMNPAMNAMNDYVVPLTPELPQETCIVLANHINTQKR